MRKLTISQSKVIKAIQTENPSLINRADGKRTKACSKAIEQLINFGLIYKNQFNVLTLSSKFHKLNKEENFGIISIDLRFTMTIEKLKSLIPGYNHIKDNIYKAGSGEYIAIISKNIYKARTVKDLYYELKKTFSYSSIPDYTALLNMPRPVL